MKACEHVETEVPLKLSQQWHMQWSAGVERRRSASVRLKLTSTRTPRARWLSNQSHRAFHLKYQAAAAAALVLLGTLLLLLLLFPKWSGSASGRCRDQEVAGCSKDPTNIER